MINNNDIFIFVAGVIVGLILAWLYRRRSAKNTNDDNNEEEVKQDFARTCNSNCVTNIHKWESLKNQCNKDGGTYATCDRRKGRQCINYYSPNESC
jgi:hypothetical protein